MQGNPFCLQPSYLSAVQQALPLLQHFDSTKAWPNPSVSTSADIAARNRSSPAAGDVALLPSSTQQYLHICFSQLSVQNTVPGRLPASQTAPEPMPPAYLYYLQLRTGEGGMVCSFPAVLTPQEELDQRQAQQSAAPAATGKKAASKAGSAGKGSKADAAEQRKAWYQEVTADKQKLSHHCIFTSTCASTAPVWCMQRPWCRSNQTLRLHVCSTTIWCMLSSTCLELEPTGLLMHSSWIWSSTLVLPAPLYWCYAGHSDRSSSCFH